MLARSYRTRVQRLRRNLMQDMASIEAVTGVEANELLNVTISIHGFYAIANQRDGQMRAMYA
jgi:hypothetical protein